MTLFNKNQVLNKEKVQQLRYELQGNSNCILKALNTVLNQILYYNDRCYESGETLAQKSGTSRRTVCRAIKLALEYNIIKRKRRFNQSNIYSLNPQLRRPDIIEELASVLPALRGLLCLSFLIPLALICKPSPRTRSQEVGTLYLTRNYLNLKTPLNLTVETPKKGSQEDRVLGWGSRIVKNREHEEPGEELQRERHYQELRQSILTFTEFKHFNQSPTYVNEVKVREYKEFMAERLPRLIESLRSVAIPDHRKIEVISRQIDAYRETLHFKDIEKLRKEGFDI